MDNTKHAFGVDENVLPSGKSCSWCGSVLENTNGSILEHAERLPSNRTHLSRAIEAALAVAEPRLGVFGLAFKENAGDLRESPVVQLLEQLIGKGREMRFYDPHIQLDRIYGSNRQYLLKAIPHIGRLMEPSLDTLPGLGGSRSPPAGGRC